MDDTPPKIYSVPRRYDLSMMFAVFVGYAVLFGVMQALDTVTPIFIGVTIFVTVVGVSQAILFGGDDPRRASRIVGSVLFVTMMVTCGVVYSAPALIGFGVILAPFLGIGLGYLAGTLASGVFLVADMTRKGIARWRPPEVPDDYDPFAP